MKSFRKCAAGFLLVLMVLATAACGNTDNNTADTPGNGASNNSSTNNGTTNNGTTSGGSVNGGALDEDTTGDGLMDDLGNDLENGVDDVMDGAEGAVDDLTGNGVGTNGTNYSTTEE